MQVELSLDWRQICANSPPDWSVVRLADVFKERLQRGDDLPLMSVTRGGWANQAETDRRDTSNDDKSNYKVVRAGDIAYNTMRMWQGRSALADSDGLVSPAYTVLIPMKTMRSDYASHLLRFPPLVRHFRAFSQGLVSDTWNLKYSAFSRLRVPLPPLPEQKKIAAILASVDQSIQATEAVIEQTRRVKDGLLQDLLTRGIGHTRFKRTKIGEIPESWEVCTLDKLYAVAPRNGYSPVCPETPNGRWVLGLGALGEHGFYPSEIKPAPPDDEKVDEYLLPPSDILISRSNTADRVGLAAMFRGEIAGCSYPDLMMRFRVRPDRVLPDYMEQYLRSRVPRSYIRGAAAGTSGSMLKINRKTVDRIPVVLPPLPEQARMMAVMKAWDRSLDIEERRLKSLGHVKAGLLQDLLTGAVRVSA